MDYERSIDGGSDNQPVNLVPELTSAASAAGRTGGILLLPDAQNIVVLPEGASLDDIVVRGRDLIIEMPDGRIFVIPDGAVYVPQRLTEKEGGQYQRHVIQPRLRDNDGTTHVDRYCPAAVCQSRPAFAQ